MGQFYHHGFTTQLSFVAITFNSSFIPLIALDETGDNAAGIHALVSSLPLTPRKRAAIPHAYKDRIRADFTAEKGKPCSALTVESPKYTKYWAPSGWLHKCVAQLAYKPRPTKRFHYDHDPGMHTRGSLFSHHCGGTFVRVAKLTRSGHKSEIAKCGHCQYTPVLVFRRTPRRSPRCTPDLCKKLFASRALDMCICASSHFTSTNTYLPCLFSFN